MFSKGTTVLAVAVALIVGSVATATGAKLITGKQIKNNSITGADIKNRSIGVADLSAGVNGSLVSFNTQQSGDIAAAPGAVVSVDVGCPSGTTVVGNGFYSGIASVGFVQSYGSFVRLAVVNSTSITATGIHVQAMCASVAGASLRSVNAGAKARADKDLAAFKAAHGG